ncbi:MAG: hypothetical protein WCD76_07570 [Pyrinomonadaceae bacterium]
MIAEEIYRAAAGWHTDECVISIGKLSLYSNLDEKNVRKHLAVIERTGLVKRLGDVVGGSDLSARGIRFRCLLPRMETPPKRGRGDESGGGDLSSPNKRRTINENQFKGDIAPSEQISEEERLRLEREYEAAQAELRRGGEGN